MGKDFLKVAISPSFNPTDDNSDSKRSADDEPEHGRRRTIMIASVHNQQESLAALRKLFLLLKFPADTYEFIFIADFKLLNICFGLSTNSATYPCVFCERSLLPGVELATQVTAAKLRTVDSIKRHAKLFKRHGGDHKSHRSCIDKPLSVFPVSQPIEEYVAQPPLHTMLGIFNWGFDLLERHLSPAITWSDHYHVVRSDYHGFCFEGNGCRRLLQDDSLDFLALTIANAPPSDDKPEANRILAVFRAFAAVRAATYSSELQPNWRDTITHFRDTVLRLAVRRFPTKVHSICAHLGNWCELLGSGCSEYSDEWIERSHHQFAVLWDSSFRIRDITNALFQTHHLRAVHRFNTSNIPIASAASELDATDT